MKLQTVQLLKTPCDPGSASSYTHYHSNAWVLEVFERSSPKLQLFDQKYRKLWNIIRIQNSCFLCDFFLQIMNLHITVWTFFSELWIYISQFGLFSQNYEFTYHSLDFFLRIMNLHITVWTFFSELWICNLQFWLFFIRITHLYLAILTFVSQN